MDISLILEAGQTLGIIGALGFSAIQVMALRRQLDHMLEQSKILHQQVKNANDNSVYNMFNKFSDRMLSMRTLQLQDEQVRQIWDGGEEGKVLSEDGLNEKHFYFAKMLFQINEAYFIALKDADLDTDSKGFHYKPWRANFKADLTSRKFRDIWSRYSIVRDSYSKPFQDEVNEIISELRADGAT